ncbi:MAG: LPXTG cell wall anchor domain-containing protein [Methylocystaceae bacterium]|jgi:LPXTG-motif cell wall-anchored protein|nr:LPXTG cell wall anchor domain-containing protein [Methylocystaceae bacterium]
MEENMNDILLWAGLAILVGGIAFIAARKPTT